jgi:hypothetical protein
VAQEKIAEVSAPGYPPQGTESGSVQRNGLNFTWRTEITNVGAHDMGGLPLKNLRRIRTLVTWQQGTSPKKLQMTTYLANSRINE